MPEYTKVSLSKSGSKSLKTTIPNFIVKRLGIALGDELLWEDSTDSKTGASKIEIFLVPSKVVVAGRKGTTALSWSLPEWERIIKKSGNKKALSEFEKTKAQLVKLVERAPLVPSKSMKPLHKKYRMR